MAQPTEMKATARQGGGKGAARAVRREGRVPAVIYGDKRTAETISLDYKELWIQINKGAFLSTIYDLDIGGQKSRVIPREVQVDPVRDNPIHVDFQRIGADGRVRINIPVRFINELSSPGLKRGGVLNIVRREIEVICPAERIPESFEVDLDGLEIGRSVHISAVKLPPDVVPTIRDRDFTICTIAGASALKQEAEEAAAAAGAEGATPEAGAAAAAPAAGDAKAAAGKDAKGGDKAPAKDDKKK